MNIFELIGAALAGSPAAYQQAATPAGWFDALLVLFICGLSLGLGQSAVLFANRVPRRRFAASLVVGAMVLISLVLLWSGALWLLAGRQDPAVPGLPAILGVVSLSFAPLVFGVFILFPYLGVPIFYGLLAWTVVNLIRILGVIFNFSLWQSLLALGMGGGIILLIVNSGLLSWLWQKVTGAQLLVSSTEIASAFAADLGASEQPSQKL